MRLLRDIRGQNRATKFLLSVLSSGKRASSYLFSGPEGVGRKETVKAFLAAIMCLQRVKRDEACGECPSCRRVENLNHPDIVWIKPGKNKSIGIDEIRSTQERLFLKPFEAPVNVAVIEDAHMMTQQASNALLKILEEPPASSMIALITSKKETLLPTVVSRCSEVRFGFLPLGEAQEIIAKVSGVTAADAHFLACLSAGSPGRAIEMKEHGVLERKKKIFEMLSAVSGYPDASCLNWDSEDKDQLFDDIEMLIMVFRDIVLNNIGMGGKLLDKGLSESGLMGCFGDYDADRINEVITKLISLKWALAGNVNPKLVAQVLPAYLK